MQDPTRAKKDFDKIMRALKKKPLPLTKEQSDQIEELLNYRLDCVGYKNQDGVDAVIEKARRKLVETSNYLKK